MGDKNRTKLSRIKVNLPIDIAQPVFPVDENGYGLGTVDALKVEGTVEIDSTTPVNVTETNSADILTELKKLDTGDQKTQIVDGDGNVIGSTDNRLNVNTVESDNFESSLVGVETWLELPENIKAVSFILDCSDNTEATLEYTFDRSASPAHSVESELGTLVNDIESGYLAGAVAQVRMDDVVTNEVLEVKSILSTALDGDNNDLVFTSKLTGVAGDAITIAYIDPAQAGALSIVVTGTDIAVNLAHDGNAITTTADDISDAIALDPAADALVGVANKAGNDGNGVVTVMAKTALTGGVNAVAATLPKLWIIGVK